MSDPASFVDVLRSRAATAPGVVACRYLEDGIRPRELTYAGLDMAARAIAAELQASTPHGCRGERALLLYPPGPDYVAAFFGCLYAGVIAVPAYPPLSDGQLDRLAALADDARPSFVLATGSMAAAGWQARLPGAPRWLVTGTADAPGHAEAASRWKPPGAGADTVAFLQYTSGTTGQPKGVIIRHGNLLSNSEFICRRFGHDESSSGVIWLPPYHDMGLIGGILQPVYAGFPVTLMSPLAFLRDPALWLRAISTYAATTSGGPNFAFDLCLRKIAAEERQSLDLSSWRVAFTGSEPVSAATMDAFSEAFKVAGFRRDAFFPCYGLAEATLMVTGGFSGALPVVARFDADELERGTAHRTDTAASRLLAGCGTPAADHDLMIVDPGTRRQVPGGLVGEIWLRGPSVSSGYWGASPDSKARLDAQGAGLPYLRTGDLGFLDAGELFVTGRLKDVIVIRGRNYAPADIERTVACSDPRLRPGRGAAFAVGGPVGEQLAIAQEVAGTRPGPQEAAALVQTIRAAVAQNHGLAVQTVSLLGPGTLPKTANGKIQRSRCRSDLLSGALTALFTGSSDPAEAVRAAAAAVLRVPAAQLDPEVPLTSYGLDSVTAVELAGRLAELAPGVAPDRALELLLGGASCADTADGAALGDGNARAADAVPDADGPERDAGEASAGALTSNERAMWFLQQLTLDSRAYYLCYAVDFAGPLDHDRLVRAVGRLSTRHPALRTTFPVREGEPIRMTAGPGPRVDRVAAAGWSDPDINADIQALEAQPLDLSFGPLWKFRHYERADGQHTLAVATHHILADLWSLTTLLRELLDLLNGGKEPHGMSPGMPAAVRLEQKYLASPQARADAQAWLDRLAGAPAVTSLPTDRPRPALPSHRAAGHQVSFGAAAAAEVRALARDLNVTPYSVILGSLYWVLHRYTGADDLVVGAPAPGRTDPAARDLVGMCVNTLPARCRVTGSQSFREVVAAAAAATRASITSQRYPFATVVERHRPQRDVSRSPVFQIVLAWQQAPGRGELAAFTTGRGRISQGEFTVTARQRPTAWAPFELTLDVAEDEGELCCLIRYHRDLWEPDTIARFADCWRDLLTRACANPEVRASELPLLARTGKRRQAPARPVPGVGLLDSLHARARETPAAVAVSDEHGRLSYADLVAAAAGVTRAIRDLGAGPEAVTAILAGRSIPFLTAALGALGVGAAYLPLDPGHPPARLAAQIRDGRPAVILSHGATHALHELAWLLGRDLPAVMDLATVPPAAPAAPHRARPDELAYVMYTSGTTGSPKGVCVHHAGVGNLLAEMSARAAIPPGSACSWWTPATFDVSVYEIFSAWQAGGRLTIVPDRVLGDALELAGWLRREQIVSAYVPPFALAALADQAEEASAAGAPMALRRLLVGVEPIPGRVLRRISAAVPGLRIINGYGPTETSICSTLYDIGPQDTGDGQVPIGDGIPNGPVYLLDRYMSAVPDGVPGEIYVGGAGVTRGYLGRPGATADRYLPDPWRAGGRMYRTGDYARRGPDGQLRFLGRQDSQVKVRGVRIELGEVEAALRSDPQVRSAAAAIYQAAGQPVLVGYVVTGPDGPAPAEVLARARTLLPASMTPAQVIVLDALPTTANGKLDRAALPAPGLDHAPYAEPRGPIEQAVAATWSRLLGGCRVGRDDDLFRLGGHSLLAARSALELSAELAREVPLALIFTNPTVGTLAEAMAAAANDGDLPLIALPRAGSDPERLREQVLALPDHLVAQLLAEQTEA